MIRYSLLASCLWLLALTGVCRAASMDNAISDIAQGKPDAGVRLKDLCEIYGVRDNQLHGIGLVVGLMGTGDKATASLRILRQMLQTKRFSVSESDLASRNVALVAVTADLPAFARNGSRLYTQISSIGDAGSLNGGILMQTPLEAADGKIYAVAQGSISIGGDGVAGPAIASGGTDHKNLRTVAILASGALVEQEVPVSLLYGDRLRLVLRNADFTTASRISRSLAEVFGQDRVSATDSTVVTLAFPATPTESELVDTIAQLQQLRVQPDMKARVVINSRTGTVVTGNEVRIDAVAVSHGGLSLRIVAKIASEQDPNDKNKSISHIVWTDPLTKITRPVPPEGTRPTLMPGSMSVIEGATVDDISNALNALGARPHDIVAIFEAIHRAGALHAELVVM